MGPDEEANGRTKGGEEGSPRDEEKEGDASVKELE